MTKPPIHGRDHRPDGCDPIPATEADKAYAFFERGPSQAITTATDSALLWDASLSYAPYDTFLSNTVGSFDPGLVGGVSMVILRTGIYLVSAEVQWEAGTYPKAVGLWLDADSPPATSSDTLYRRATTNLFHTPAESMVSVNSFDATKATVLRCYDLILNDGGLAGLGNPLYAAVRVRQESGSNKNVEKAYFSMTRIGEA